MAATKAVLGIDWTVEFDDGAGGAFQVAPEPVEIGNLGVTGEFVDVTNLSSADRTREFIKGLQSGEERQMSFRFLEGNTEQGNLIDHAAAGDTIQFRFTGPKNFDEDTRPTLLVTMVLNGYQIESPTVDGPLNLLISARDTGAWTKGTAAA